MALRPRIFVNNTLEDGDYLFVLTDRYVESIKHFFQKNSAGGRTDYENTEMSRIVNRGLVWAMGKTV